MFDNEKFDACSFSDADLCAKHLEFMAAKVRKLGVISFGSSEERPLRVAEYDAEGNPIRFEEDGDHTLCLRIVFAPRERKWPISNENKSSPSSTPTR